MSIFSQVVNFFRGNTTPSEPPPTTNDFITNYDYPAETHNVTTDDGYVLTIHRIPHGTANQNTNGPPVLIMHGISSSSCDFVHLGPGRSLAFLLVDAGFDVWIGNSRGNEYSRGHVSLDINKNPEKFFDFSWHEIGYYDLPACIDYILESTQNERLFYLGHSQGTTAFFVLASTRPEYNEKIKLASLLAPAAFLEHRPFVFSSALCNYVNAAEKLMRSFKVYSVPFMSPPRTAMKQYLHFGQLIKNGGFSRYDYGVEKNLEVYGSEHPPAYDLSKISTPVAVYYAKNDDLVPYEDVLNVVSKLPNIVKDFVIQEEHYSHIDFIFRNENVILYREILDMMEKYK